MPSPPLVLSGGSFGTPALAALNALISGQGLLTQGNVYWVKPRTGSDSGVDGLSPINAFQSLGKALATATANQNDVVILCAESNTASQTTNYLTANLDWNKDMVHLIGVNAGPMIGQRSRIANLSTAAPFANLFTVSANGCLIQNIEFFQGNGSTNPTAASTCVTVTGQRCVFRNCQISGIGHADLDDVGSNSLTLTAAQECLFEHCYIGLDTIIRATSVTEVILAGACTRIIFDKCHFETYTSASTFKMVTIPTAADRFVKFLDCDFVAVQNITSAVIPTGLIGITTMNGQVIIKNPYLYGFTQYVTADNAYVQMLGTNGLATGHLIGIAQGVDAT